MRNKRKYPDFKRKEKITQNVTKRRQSRIQKKKKKGGGGEKNAD